METKKQKLFKRKTYIPTDTSLVCSSMISTLNKEETLSDANLKTLDNNLEENLHQQTDGLKVKVFVIAKSGKILMPTTPRKARVLLKENKAKVVTTKPFTIQLNWDCEEKTQETTLGIDTGSKVIGYSVTTKTKELISGEFNLRQDVSKNIQYKVMYRRNRRNKLWYRKPRFKNRTKSKHEGWLAPSVKHKIDSHIRLIDKIKSILPISNLIIESTQFDAQKLQNPDIKGREYQEGKMFGFENVKMFVRQRDNYTCQICKKKDDKLLEVHHIKQKKDSGSNRPDNLVTLHSSCHKKLHLGRIKHNFIKPKSYKETSMMNSLWSRLKVLLDCEETFGYITKIRRKELGLEKTHNNDAFVISGGINQERCCVNQAKQIRRNNRCLQLNRKGFKPSIRRKRYVIQPNDVVIYKNKNYITKGSHCKGSRAIIEINGKNKSLNIKYLEVKSFGKGIVLSTRQFLTTLKGGVSLAQTVR